MRPIDLLPAAFFANLLTMGVVSAQTAPQAVIGYLSTSCGAGPSPCFIPYGATIATTGGGGGDATAANQVIQTNSLTAILNAATAMIPAGTNTIGNIGTISVLPGVTIANAPTVSIGNAPTVVVTGVATSANQTTEITNLGSINTTLAGPTPGGTNDIGTIHVGGTVPVSGTTTIVPSGTQSVQSFATIITNSMTRVSNTTVYTANTGWNIATAGTSSSQFTFTGACPVNSGIVLISEIDIYSSANPTTKLAGNLWLFSSVPGTLIGDNAAFTLAAADYGNLTGGTQNGIPFSLGSAQSSGAANSGTAITGINTMAICNSGTAAVYGLVEVTNTYTPAASEVLTIKLKTVGL